MNNESKNNSNKDNKSKRSGIFSKIPFFARLKSIKNIEIVIAVLIIGVMFLIYFGSLDKPKSKTINGNSPIKYTSCETYVRDLEARISNTLSKIDGAGKVSVVITLSSSSELVIAKDVESTTHSESITKNGVTTKTEEIVVIEKPILVDGRDGDKPLVVLEVMPKIAGVVVVSDGAKDVEVKLNLLKAIQALLIIPNGNIEIIS